ncbi:aldehyde dehydrogenase family protein [Jatrophihabitans telluris]|uniref:Aldehyde dehydrogenase family protein n=1 Tax=Jatrophihabitans telluris TaxID=2038343 RepID=A0ABY4R395_9ACTN|nr:aldehyde dehydrogenase family protein [Jatrophihabitans telluris]UQX89878.1 aldehyde dehydrogenase family protein [Jatrophihabitans telluris]
MTAVSSPSSPPESTAPARPAGREDGTFESVNPATGASLGRYAVADSAEVDDVVARARDGAVWWQSLGEPGRRTILRRWRAELVARSDELARLIHLENGKTMADAVIEVSIAIAHLDWAARHARTVLGKRRVNPGVLAPNHAATVEYLPFGVVGVIGPWNYPVHTPMGSISYALAAGNAVVFKPSEYTPGIGQWLVDSFAPLVEDRAVFVLVTGLGATGAALCRAGIDKLAFTGSARTGKLVMAACAEHLTPCLVECGGKDPMIVAADANLDLAVDQALWGAMSNGGQTCAGVERVYVEAAVYADFVERVAVRARQLRSGGAGAGAGAGGGGAHDHVPDYGPITMPGQLEVIARHIDAALADGGRAVVGGPNSVRPPYVDPVVLVDVPADSIAVTEETFGPTVVVSQVADLDEAVRRANSTTYGLGASVFSRRQGRQVADRLDAGMVSINSVLTYASIPGLPWGGSKDSGFGRIHGPDGLREFARSRAVTRERFPIPLKVTSFARGEKAIGQLRQLVRARWGHR